MRILLIGASGFIGRHLLHSLRSAGHDVTGAGRARPAGADSADGAWRELDMAQLHLAAAWRPHLAGFDAVMYCVGIFSAADHALLEHLHHAVPAALFAACAGAGVRRVVYLSALGSDAEAVTPYWRSKGRGEDALRASPLDYTIVRPSLVYGADGASSRLFLALASLPVAALPAGGKVQPVHIADLCDAMAALLRPEHRHLRTLDAVGPVAMPLPSYLAELRHGMRAGPALVLPAPLMLARAAARLALLLPSSAMTSAATPDALAMLARGNTADASAMHTLLERPMRTPATFATPAQRAGAVLAWCLPLARLVLAMLWLWTAYVSWFGWPHHDSLAWLAACGVPAPLQVPMLAGASMLDAAIGCALLWRTPRWLWLLQLALVGGYTAIMSVSLPAFWLHPFGPLSKNLPILVLLLLMWRLHPADKKHGE